jgi:hypothetical protein
VLVNAYESLPLWEPRPRNRRLNRRVEGGTVRNGNGKRKVVLLKSTILVFYNR